MNPLVELEKLKQALIMKFGDIPPDLWETLENIKGYVIDENERRTTKK
jgi:hypothetical protein